ncbi:glycosyl hydrolase [Salmonella bongori]|nr:glycosyl hydrolase [Salmonella bongori]
MITELNLSLSILNGYIKALARAVAVLATHMWTFIDNWSWLNGYKNRYGFVQLDLTTQTRTVKKSGEWFAATAEHNGFD